LGIAALLDAAIGEEIGKKRTSREMQTGEGSYREGRRLRTTTGKNGKKSGLWQGRPPLKKGCFSSGSLDGSGGLQKATFGDRGGRSIEDEEAWT